MHCRAVRVSRVSLMAARGTIVHQGRASLPPPACPSLFVQVEIEECRDVFCLCPAAGNVRGD
jgi:hypothetical protein